MVERKKVYWCAQCGNIIESLSNGGPDISCCGKKMEARKLNSTDAAVEKHVPVIERDGNKVTVKVGEVPHPMTEDHYISFIEVLAGDKVYRQDFDGSSPEAKAVFFIEETEIKARAYCNLHGFWESSG